MDIQRTGAFEPVSRLQRNITRRENPAAPTDGQDFSQTDALRGALDNLPSSRPDKVREARQLAENVEYPPVKTMRQISDLLAVKMQGPLAM